MTQRLVRKALQAVCLFGLVACSPAPSVVPAAAEIAGTMRFVEVEGGCWGIEIERERVQPTRVPDEFKQDGLAVWVQFEVLSDVATTCQIGKPVDVKSIRKR